MADSSVNAKFELLRGYDLIHPDYKDISVNLVPYNKVTTDAMEYVIKNLLSHVSIQKITGKQDLPFLTLDEEEVNKFVDFFNKSDKDLKFETMRSFIGDPTKLFDRINHAIKYGIPYKNQTNELLSIFLHEDEACKLYLKGYYRKQSPDNMLSEEELDLFNKVSGILQRYVYDTNDAPLIIFDPLEKDIVSAVKSNPNLSAEEIAVEVAKINSSLRVIAEGLTLPIATSGSDGSRRQTGQR